MAGLTYHKTLTDVTAYATGDKGEVLRVKMNANEDQLIANAQSVEDALEDTIYETFGSGVLTGMVPSVGTGLTVAVTTGTALIGRMLTAYAGGSIAVEANATPGYIYYNQDGTWTTNKTGTPPSTKSYFEFCQYTSGAATVSAVTTPPKILPCNPVSYTQTFEDLLVEETHYRDYLIDHTALGTLTIPGFITLTVTPSDAFTVAHIDPELDTATSFYVRISRDPDYYDYTDYYYTSSTDYGLYAQCDLTFVRTGLAYN